MLNSYTYRKVFSLLAVALIVLVFLSFLAVGEDSSVPSETSETPSEQSPETTTPQETTSLVENPTEQSPNSPEVYVPIDDVLKETQVPQPTTQEETNTSEEPLQEGTYINLDEINATSPKDNPESSEPKKDVYVKIDEINSQNPEIIETPKDSTSENQSIPEGPRPVEENSKEISYVFYKDNQKEIETKAPEGLDLQIKKEESVVENDDAWKKDVKVYSEEHYENELTVYSDITKTKAENINIYWKEENKKVDFQTIDEDDDGLIERISWIVPHLSEQNFEIVINFTESSQDSPTLTLYTLTSPSGIINSSVKLAFNFGINYTNLSDVECNILLKNQDLDRQEYTQNASNLSWAIDSSSLENANYIWNLNCYDKNFPEINDSEQGAFVIDINYPITVTFSWNTTQVQAGGAVMFSLGIINASNNPRYYTISYGDGSALGQETINSYNFNRNMSHVYSSNGTKTVLLSVYSGINQINRTVQITVSTPPYVDNENPKVNLIEPANNADFPNESITFRYNATDNIKLSNCTFTLYYYNHSSFGKSVYNSTKNGLGNGEEVSVRLTDFDDGDYTWDVECYDNSSNSGSKSRDFTISTTSQQSQGVITLSQTLSNETLSNEDAQKSKEMDDLVSLINDFLVKEEKFNAEQKEVVQDLGISDNLNSYKKKLLQMKLDLTHNLDFMKDATQRENRRNEILAEVENITDNLVTNVEVKSSHEYSKNSLDFNLVEVVDAYVTAKNIKLTDNEKKAMAQQNEGIQKDITSSVKARQVKLEYKDKTKEITLVTKEINFKNKSFDSLIEVIPKEIAETADKITFVNANQVIKSDPIFEIGLDDVTDNKLVYYVNGLVVLDEIEKTSTISFKESVPESGMGGISGFATFVSGGNERGFFFYFSWVIVLCFFIFIGTASVRKIRISSWKKDQNARRIFEIIRETRAALKNKEIEIARERYKEAEGVYPKVPPKCKKFVYGKLKELNIEIDKKDIANLVKEFISSAKQDKKEEALMLYENIKSLYPKMPNKFKQKVYSKIVPYVKSLNK
jgi:hypothetical protein